MLLSFVFAVLFSTIKLYKLINYMKGKHGYKDNDDTILILVKKGLIRLIWFHAVSIKYI